MGLVIVAPGKERLVRGDDRDAAPIGKIKKRRLDEALRLEIVALQLNVQPIPEQLREPLASGGRDISLAGRKRSIERPGGATTERNQAIGCSRQRIDPQVGRLARLRCTIRAEPRFGRVPCPAGGLRASAARGRDGTATPARGTGREAWHTD